jgi:hypothetical protein
MPKKDGFFLRGKIPFPLPFSLLLFSTCGRQRLIFQDLSGDLEKSEVFSVF